MSNPTLVQLDKLITNVRERLEQHPDFITLTALERARADIVGTAPLPFKRAPKSNIFPDSVVVVERPVVMEAEALPDAATMPEVTQKQADVFKALIAACAKSSKRQAYPGLIRKLSLYSNVEDALASLRDKGYCAQAGERGSYTWTYLATGTPRVMTENDWRGRTWGTEELGELRLVAVSENPDYKTFATKVQRTIIACEAKARSMGWFQKRPIGRPALPRPVAEQPEEAADEDDLSSSARDMLLALATCGEGFHSRADILNQTATIMTPEKSAIALQRLVELKLAMTMLTGKWCATQAGTELAAKIRAAA